MRRSLLGLTAVAALGLAACQNNPNAPGRNTGIGAGAGAATGAVLGNVLSGGNETAGTITGAAIGSVLGAGAGYLFDRQQRDLEQALATEQANNAVEIQRVREDLLRVNLQNEVTFPTDSSVVNPAFQPSLQKLAGVLTQYPDTPVTIVGHTDSTGAESYNQGLSQRRAQAVAGQLASYGVNFGRINTVGVGESQPRADNSTQQGRQLNRRVEILVGQV